VRRQGATPDERASAGEDPDRLVVRRARAGDARAFDDLVRRHQSRIFALVRRLVPVDAAAEELTQDIFLKAHRALPAFRGGSTFSTWLYRIAVNHVRDYRGSRASRRHEIEVSLDGPELAGFDPVAGTAAPDEGVGEIEMAERFASCVNSLDARLREAFVLRHQENMGYDEIGEVLGISRANAKVRVHRARERILEMLRETGHEV
jgi:RNA polymerase sigma-70 factor (ECF subfamily)